jgi:hypothetical protein
MCWLSFSLLEKSNGEIPLFQSAAMRDVYLFKSYLFCRSCIDDVRAQLDKLGRRPALTDHETDPEVYPLNLEKASEEEPEDWNMECCICDRPKG